MSFRLLDGKTTGGYLRNVLPKNNSGQFLDSPSRLAAANLGWLDGGSQGLLYSLRLLNYAPEHLGEVIEIEGFPSFYHIQGEPQALGHEPLQEAKKRRVVPIVCRLKSFQVSLLLLDGYYGWRIAGLHEECVHHEPRDPPIPVGERMN